MSKDDLRDKFEEPEEESKSINEKDNELQTQIHLSPTMSSKLNQRVETLTESSSGHSSCPDVEIKGSDSSLEEACLSLRAFFERNTDIKSEEFKKIDPISLDGYMDLYNITTCQDEELSIIRYSHYSMGVRAACMGLNQKLNHDLIPYLVKVLKVEKKVDSASGKPALQIITERLGERLSTFVNNHREDRSKLSRETMIRWLLCIARALEGLSKQNITIISLNPKKTIINGLGAKILDLSYSTYGKDKPIFLSVPEWKWGAMFRAPELLDNKPIEPSMDIYSFGVIMYYIVLAPSDPEFESFFKDKTFQSRPIPQDCLAPTELIALMKRCIQLDPKRRPTASDLVRILSELLSKTHSPLVSLSSICSSNFSSSSSSSSSTSFQFSS